MDLDRVVRIRPSGDRSNEIPRRHSGSDGAASITSALY